jgi:crotonobetainyl-CoA:carnitine CoA-transferase CaiB-like acyl-CoA transferase
VSNQAVLYALIETVMATRSNRTWIELLEREGVPCAPVQSIGEMLAHDQTRALELLQPVPGSEMSFIGLPVSFDGVRPSIRHAPPGLGQHTAEIFPAAKS